MAEALDPRFSPEPSLQQGFIDKNTGLPLANGIVTFFSNNNRTVLKPIFQLQEALPGGPVTYVPLPNPIVLSGIGTFMDANGNDIIPYYFPFDGLGNVELYYITVTDQFGNQQLTREAFPNATGTGLLSLAGLTNFVANGQLLIHNGGETATPLSQFPVTPNFVYTGLDTVNVYYVAQGGFTFERSTTSTAVDNIAFLRENTFVDGFLGSPRYFININRSVGSADATVDLRIKFNDVFKFRSPSLTNSFTLFFNARSLIPLSNVALDVLIVDYFGSGVATNPVETPKATIIINSIDQQYAVNFNFPNITGGTVGPNDDDYVQIAIRLPHGALSTFNVEFTDFILYNANLTVNTPFPVTTNGKFLEDASFNNAPANYSVTPPIPGTPTNQPYYFGNGYNLFLPFIMTGEGLSYDFSQVGRIETYPNTVGFSTSVNSGTNLLLCDGSSYVTSAYSPLGIPYARLQQQLFISGEPFNIPIYGTGNNFVTVSLLSSDNESFFITRNEKHIENITTVATANPTGFTFTQVYTSVATDYAVKGFISGTTTAGMDVFGNIAGVPLADVVDGANPTGFVLIQQINLLLLKQYFTVDATAVGVPPANSFFQFGNTTTKQFMWFSVNGIPAVPPGGLGTPIHCSLLSTYNNVDVIDVIRCTMNNQETSSIKITGIPPAGSFWTFFANGLQYNVWYSVNGSGVAPAAPSGANIEVSITNVMTKNQIAVATKAAINSYQFSVPQLQGMFIRGNDPNAVNDPQATNRYSLNNGILYKGNKIGTYQIQNTEEHIHAAPFGLGNNFVSGSGASLNIAAGASGSLQPFDGANLGAQNNNTNAMGQETRPINIYLNYAIRY